MKRKLRVKNTPSPNQEEIRSAGIVDGKFQVVLSNGKTLSNIQKLDMSLNPGYGTIKLQLFAKEKF